MSYFTSISRYIHDTFFRPAVITPTVIRKEFNTFFVLLFCYIKYFPYLCNVKQNNNPQPYGITDKPHDMFTAKLFFDSVEVESKVYNSDEISSFFITRKNPRYGEVYCAPHCFSMDMDYNESYVTRVFDANNEEVFSVGIFKKVRRI